MPESISEQDRPRLGGAKPSRNPILSYVSGAIDNLAGIALLLMLASVLLPSAYYSYNLKDPTAEQLLIAICIGLFSSLLFLWIMDAVSILRFRAEWVSKSVYGAAVVSILGTSVGVYRQAFSENKYPYEGRWNLTLIDDDQVSQIIDLDVSFVYSERSDSYWGYSDYKPAIGQQKDAAVWATLGDFGPKEGNMVLAWFDGNGNRRSLVLKVDAKRQGKLFEGKLCPENYSFIAAQLSLCLHELLLLISYIPNRLILGEHRDYRIGQGDRVPVPRHYRTKPDALTT